MIWFGVDENDNIVLRPWIFVVSLDLPYFVGVSVTVKFRALFGFISLLQCPGSICLCGNGCKGKPRGVLVVLRFHVL